MISVSAKTATVRHRIGDNELRPGDAVSGPVLMAVADVTPYSEGSDDPVAHAVGTYALPPDR